MINTPLFVGQLVRLSPLEPERDAETISRWTHEPSYLRQLTDGPAQPLSTARVKKQLEKAAKHPEGMRRELSFAVHACESGELLGMLSFERIQWSNAVAQLKLTFGAPEAWENGAAAETLRMALRYAFAELNLYRLEAQVSERQAPLIALVTAAGFYLEVRRRQALYCDGRHWDMLDYGLLREEWHG